MNSAENELYQQVTLDHKRSPRHFGKLPQPTHRARGTNPQCGDDISVELQIDGARLGEIRFTGQGCAICIASTSMMTEAVRGQEVEFARQLQQRYRAVITGQLEPDAAQLGKLVSLSGVRRYPSRIKCALLGWHALMHAIDTPTGDAAPAAGTATTSMA
ncbi:MAG: SUF system NifU family Fe-S cluster assembly protein [Ideonella sp.]|nr:MAG: SUF system NifU family Fe-S cluster assembly protein [Burkholderiaceae bacterium]MBE7425337.1 SUF system NifU family Fe-S cluster assembly protein [Ideonella sp.]